MHRADVVLIGPIEPLLPRVVRVPLPVALAGGMGMVYAALVVVAVVVTLRPVAAGLLPVAVSGASGASDVVPIVLVSEPVGAEVRVDNRELAISLPPQMLLETACWYCAKSDSLIRSFRPGHRVSRSSFGERNRTCDTCGRQCRAPRSLQPISCQMDA
jgi:hypothetical protein